MRRVIGAMLMNTAVLSKIAPLWPAGGFQGLFDNKVGDQVGFWAVEHYRQFSQAPGQAITAIYQDWIEQEGANKEITDAVEKMLQAASDEFNPEWGTDYLLDLAKNVFNSIQQESVSEKAKRFRDRKQHDQALSVWQSYQPITFDPDETINLKLDSSVWEEAFRHRESEALVSYPGALGEFFKNLLQPGELYAFQGPDKAGKSTSLRDFAFRACKSYCNVAFFDTGDGNKFPFIRQMGCRSAGQPEKSRTVKIPEGWDDDGNLLYTENDMESTDWEYAFKRFGRAAKRGNPLKYQFHPNQTLTIGKIHNQLDEWEQKEGWTPHVVIIDYADILAPPPGAKETLDQIDQNWKQLSRLAKERQVLLMTATQSSAKAYTHGRERKWMSREHFSGRKTKLAEVDGMIGINLCKEEHDNQIVRWNWIVVRGENEFVNRVGVELAGCYALKNPAMISRWFRQKDSEDE